MNLKLLLSLSFVLASCGADTQQAHPVQVEEKIKGFNYTGPGRGPIPPDMISSMKQVNGNYVAFIPEATLHRQNLDIVYNRRGGWFGESMEATLQGIELARKNDLNIMLKPHITVGYSRSGFNLDWSDIRDSVSREEYRERFRTFLENQPNKLENNDRWRGTIMVKNEADWQTLAGNYTDFILDYANLADSLDVDIFCIGTELKAMALQKPEYWQNLITQVKKIYDGQLTYAANWDSYNRITFWEDLDYIGIDAYFPLSKEKNPNLPLLMESWQPYKMSVEQLSRKYNKPVLFTEWGYENEDYAAEEPWVANGRETEDGGPHNHDHINDNAQVILYQATFQSFWNEPWFAGLFLWRWSPPGEMNRGIPTYNYSPKDKPAEQTLRKWFGDS